MHGHEGEDEVQRGAELREAEVVQHPRQRINLLKAINQQHREQNFWDHSEDDGGADYPDPVVPEALAHTGVIECVHAPPDGVQLQSKEQGGEHADTGQEEACEVHRLPRWHVVRNQEGPETEDHGEECGRPDLDKYHNLPYRHIDDLVHERVPAAPFAVPHEVIHRSSTRNEHHDRRCEPHKQCARMAAKFVDPDVWRGF
mmetsp:Transcript_210/g.270  ORF Transcript_210/g.270 Transcript_210/m.270 type:complete len:200 (-) Transcript_210:221-820(-)